MITHAVASPSSTGAGGRALRHIVLDQFKDDLPSRQLREVVDAFTNLPKKIATIVGFEAGTNVSNEGKSQGLTHAFVVSSGDETDRDAYLTHPTHLDYVKLFRDRRENVVFPDYWAAE
jgi:hypothetical protein